VHYPELYQHGYPASMTARARAVRVLWTAEFSNPGQEDRNPGRKNAKRFKTKLRHVAHNLGVDGLRTWSRWQWRLATNWPLDWPHGTPQLLGLCDRGVCDGGG